MCVVPEKSKDEEKVVNKDSLFGKMSENSEFIQWHLQFCAVALTFEAARTPSSCQIPPCLIWPAVAASGCSPAGSKDEV